MLAHNIQKSRFGEFGFDTINIFTNDEIYCTGFCPSAEQIREIGKFIESVNKLSFSKFPVCLYITRKNSLYWMDLKLICLGEPVFADSQESLFSEALNKIEKKVFDQIPSNFYCGFDSKEVSTLYN